MIKLQNFVKFAFARNRLRRQIYFEPKLKDYTSQQDVVNQTKELRDKFESIPS